MEALVLFDIDGLTAVVATNQLFDADGCSAVEATHDLDKQFLKSSTWFVLGGGKRLLAEVLEIADSREQLDAYENEWVLSHRAIHIRELRKKKIKGGFLSSWPNDVEDLEYDVHDHIDTVGSNNRVLNVLYEGSQETSNVEAEPARQPGFNSHLNQDERDILDHKLREYSRGKRTVGLQTEKVLIFEDERDMLKSCRKANKTEISDIVEKLDFLTNLVLEQTKLVKTFIAAPMVSQSGPVIPTPVIETPAIPTPVIPAPVIQTPALNVSQSGPVIPTPVIPIPVIPTPVISAPVIQTPAPNVSQSGPVIPTPVIETPAIPTPVIPAPVIQTPAPNVSQSGPVIPTPVIETPAIPTPVIPAPVIQTPALNVSQSGPVIPTPVIETPAIPTPVIPAPVIQKPAPNVSQSGPVIPTPVIETPAIPTPVIPAPVIQTPAPNVSQSGPVIPTPVIETPAIPTPVIQAPVIQTPAPNVSHLGPVIPTPVIPAPVIPIPVIPTPVIPAPVIQTPAPNVSQSGPVIPTPVIETPVIPTPVIPAPVIPIPAPNVSQSRPVIPTPVIQTPAPNVSQSGQALETSVPIFNQSGSITNRTCHPQAIVSPPAPPANVTACGNIINYGFSDPTASTSSEFSAVPLYTSPGIDYLHDLSEEEARFQDTDYPPTVHQRSPLSTINHDHLNNYIEIKNYTDMHTVGKESKVRVAKHVVQEIRQGSTSVGNFGWGLAKRLYSTEELLQCNYRGVGKQALSPRRKRCIEEAVRDNYGNNQEILRGVRKSIDAGIRDKKKRVPAPSTTSHPSFILPQGFDYNMLLKNLQAATSHDSLHKSNMF